MNKKLDECIEYLSAWVKTRNDTYKPLATNAIPKNIARNCGQWKYNTFKGI